MAARAGKPTIYARFGDKRALFSAVVTRDVLSRIAQFNRAAPTGGPIEERPWGSPCCTGLWKLKGWR